MLLAGGDNNQWFNASPWDIRMEKWIYYNPITDKSSVKLDADVTTLTVSNMLSCGKDCRDGRTNVWEEACKIWLEELLDEDDGGDDDDGEATEGNAEVQGLPLSMYSIAKSTGANMPASSSFNISEVQEVHFFSSKSKLLVL